MSCKKNCGRKTCHKCYPEQDTCYDLDVLDCPTPCPNGTMEVDCLFYSIDNPSQGLKNLNIKSTTSLRRLFQVIDKLVGNTGVVNLSGINWWGLNPTEKDLSKLFETIQFISDNLQKLVDEDEDINSTIVTINNRIDAVSLEIDEMNAPSISSSLLGINLNDNIATVLTKIVEFIENLPAPVIYNYNVTVEISQQQGNKILILPDGIYVPDTSALTILDEICDTPELNTKFKDMVNKAGLRHKFFLSNSSPSSITVDYISYGGLPQQVAVPANGGIEISNVRLILTNPTSILTITYKGNE